MKHRQNGVTLIELMIVVTVVAILAAIAYPSYRNQIMRSHRAEAKAALLQVQVAQEKHFLQNNAYVTTAPLLTALPSASPPGLGIAATTAGGYYTITVGTNGAAPSYLATATATSKQDDDTSCLTFSIDQSGSRLPASGCW